LKRFSPPQRRIENRQRPLAITFANGERIKENGARRKRCRNVRQSPRLKQLATVGQAKQLSSLFYHITDKKQKKMTCEQK